MIVLVILFICIWVVIIHELKNAPEIDVNGNIIKRNDKKK